MKLKEPELRIINDFAIREILKLSTHSLYQNDNKMAQTYAFTSAVISYLTSKNLLKEEVIIDDNMKPNYEKD